MYVFTTKYVSRIIANARTFTFFPSMYFFIDTLPRKYKQNGINSNERE